MAPANQYVPKSAKATGGKNGNVLNFVVMAIPTAMPNQTLFVAEGASRRRFQHHKANKKAATNGMSVVASPECPTTDGNVATNMVERDATNGFLAPPQRTHVSSRTSQKNRRLAIRASVTFRT